MGLEVEGGVSRWTAKPIQPGEYAVKINNGETYQLQEDGTVTRVVPQPSMWRVIFNMTPHAQMIDQLVHPYVQTNRGWLGQPDPIRKSDGSIVYPIELRDALLNMVPFVPRVRTMNPKEEKLREQKRNQRLMRDVWREIRRLPTERRAEGMKVLRSIQRGKYRAPGEE